jgi:hypothetical protein
VTFWRRVFQFQKEKIAPWLALRNTLGFALPLGAGIALGNIPAALIAAIGALNVSYSGKHDALAGMLASSHRLIHAIMALEAGLQGSRPVPARIRSGALPITWN